MLRAGNVIARTGGGTYWIRSCPATGRQECAGTSGLRLIRLRRETVSNVVNGKTHKRVREHDLRELQTPEQRAAKYDRALSKALELRARRHR